MNKNIIWVWLLLLAITPSSALAQLYDYKDFFSQRTYDVTKTEDLVYGVGATNYFLYTGSGDVNNRNNYRHVTRKPLDLDLYKPNMSASAGDRAVLIIIPGSGRSGCQSVGSCTLDTIRQNNISTRTAYYISQEGNNYNELNDRNRQGVNFARRGFVVVSPNTRYRYHNKLYEDATGSNWSRSDGSPMLNGSASHLEPLVVDLKRIVRWLSHPEQVSAHNIDPDNIYIMGSSGAAKMASLSAMIATNSLLTDDPAQIAPGHPDYQFEVNNNNLNITQRAVRGVVLSAGDAQGTRNVRLIDEDTDSAFMFWHGTTDRAILHGMAEAIEEKCDLVECISQFYSLPGVEHSRTGQGRMLHTHGGTETVGLNAHVHDFMVNLLKRNNDSRPQISISPRAVTFSESTGMARVEVLLDRAVSHDIQFTMSADQMREVMQADGRLGSYDLIEQYVANSSDSTGPIVYDQGSGVAFEENSNLPQSLRGLAAHQNGPGQGNPVVIPSSSDYFNSDFNGKKQVLSIPAGQTRATFNVGLVNDLLLEQNECFKVRLLNADGARIGNAVETITILDDDNPNAGTGVSATCRNPNQSSTPPPPPPPPAAAKISVQPTSVVENGGQVNVTVVSDIAVSNDVVLSYRTIDGSAESGVSADFISRQGQVTIRRSQRQATIPITINDDSLVENRESFVVELRSVVAGNARIVDSRATVNIVSDDVVVTPTLSLRATYTTEEVGIAFITVTSDKPLTEDITVSYRTRDGSATVANNDYESRSGRITITKSRDRTVIPIPINADSVPEGNEKFYVTLDAITDGNGSIGVDRASVTIVENGAAAAPVISVVATSVLESDRRVNVEISSDVPTTDDIIVRYRTVIGSAESGRDYVYTDGEATIRRSRTQALVPVVIKDDSLAEGDEVFGLEIVRIISGNAVIGNAEANIRIIDDEPAVNPRLSAVSTFVGEISGTVFVRVVSDQPVKEDVTVSYQTVPGSATLEDYTHRQGTVKLTKDRSQVSIPIDILDDLETEANETFSVVLRSVVSGNAVISRATATVTIVDDESKRTDISINSKMVSENIGQARVQVVSNRPVPEDTVVSYKTVAGTASSRDGDYRFTEGSITIRRSETTATILIDIFNDKEQEPDEVFYVRLERVTSNNGNITISLAQVTIAENDQPVPPMSPIIDLLLE